MWTSFFRCCKSMIRTVEGTFFQSMFNGLVKERQVLGSVRPGVHWTPNVFSIAQRECVDSFYSQVCHTDAPQFDRARAAIKMIKNSLVSYESLHKPGLTQNQRRTREKARLHHHQPGLTQNQIR